MNWYDSTVKYVSDELTNSKEGIDLITNFEGLRLKAYRDSVDVWTIGYGHTKDVKIGDIITHEKALYYLDKDLNYFEEVVNTLVIVPLTQWQFDALVSFTFNLGEGNLESSTLLKKLNKENYREAAEEFTKWVYAGGEKLDGLVKRRNAEKLMFQGQDWKEYINEY